MHFAIRPHTQVCVSSTFSACPLNTASWRLWQWIGWFVVVFACWECLETAESRWKTISVEDGAGCGVGLFAYSHEGYMGVLLHLAHWFPSWFCISQSACAPPPSTTQPPTHTPSHIHTPTHTSVHPQTHIHPHACVHAHTQSAPTSTPIHPVPIVDAGLFMYKQVHWHTGQYPSPIHTPTHTPIHPVRVADAGCIVTHRSTGVPAGALLTHTPMPHAHSLAHSLVHSLTHTHSPPFIMSVLLMLVCLYYD